MKVQLITVSHRQPDWVAAGSADYERRLPREWSFSVVEIKPTARSAGTVGEKVRAAEALRIQAALAKNAQLIALDERGKLHSTEQFAAQLRKWQTQGRDLSFVIGGADGLDPELLARAEARLSLSPLTLPHGLARVVLSEQLYRVATLLAGHPYHRA